MFPPTVNIVNTLNISIFFLWRSFLFVFILRMFRSRTSALFFVFFFQVLCQLCNRPCLCPASVPQCAAGVPLVPDGCRCCQVCARQRGESCSEMLPCDRQKGLQCDFSASFPGDPGECVGEWKAHLGGMTDQICMSEQHRQ